MSIFYDVFIVLFSGFFFNALKWAHVGLNVMQVCVRHLKDFCQIQRMSTCENVHYLLPPSLSALPSPAGQIYLALH